MKLIYTTLLIFFINVLFAQRVIYSEPNYDEKQENNFEIIGKINDNILVYKGTTQTHYINVYDFEMKLKQKTQLDFINDRVFNTDFILYPNQVLSFYQYQKRNIIYNMAAKIDGNGKIIGSPIQLDTTDSRSVQNNKIYSFVQSANKEYIMFFKINSYDEKIHKVNTYLYNKNLELLKKGYAEINMKERNSFLTGFDINNKGSFIFYKAIATNTGDNINDIKLFIKEANNDTFNTVTLKKQDNIFLDEIKVKVDNANNRFITTSFFSNKRRGDIQGLYISVFDAEKDEEVLSTTTVFDENFRKDAKGTDGIKQAFNNYFIKNIIPKKNGGFIMCSESAYTNSRSGFDNFNRWDYWNNNNFSTFNSGFYSWDNTMLMPWGRTFSNNISRYFADNIAVVSLDSTGKIEWNNVIFKSQYSDNTDAFLSYGTFNAGNQLRFLYNSNERDDLILTEQSISPDGQINRASNLKNLDKGYVFLPNKTKQIGAKQIIVPCMYRNNLLCFAKIDY